MAESDVYCIRAVALQSSKTVISNPTQDYDFDCSKLEIFSPYSNRRAPVGLWFLTIFFGILVEKDV